MTNLITLLLLLAGPTVGADSILEGRAPQFAAFVPGTRKILLCGGRDAPPSGLAMLDPVTGRITAVHADKGSGWTSASCFSRPAFSRDGRIAVFVVDRGRETEEEELAIVYLAGGRISRTLFLPPPLLTKGSKIFPRRAEISDASVMPDGKHVLYLTSQEWRPYRWRATLRSLSLETMKSRTVREFGERAASIAALPDGRRAIVSVLYDLWHARLAMVDLRSRASRFVSSRGIGGLTDLSVTPDGRHVVCGVAAEDFSIWSFDVDRRRGQRISGKTEGADSWDKHPAVSPDGQSVLFICDGRQLVMLDLRSGKTRNLLGAKQFGAVGRAPGGRGPVTHRVRLDAKSGLVWQQRPLDLYHSEVKMWLRTSGRDGAKTTLQGSGGYEVTVLHPAGAGPVVAVVRSSDTATCELFHMVGGELKSFWVDDTRHGIFLVNRRTRHPLIMFGQPPLSLGRPYPGSIYERLAFRGSHVYSAGYSYWTRHGLTRIG